MRLMECVISPRQKRSCIEDERYKRSCVQDTLSPDLFCPHTPSERETIYGAVASLGCENFVLKIP